MIEAHQAATNLVQHLTKQSSSTLTKVAPKTVLRAFLLSEDTYTTVLTVMVADLYGTECFQWSPETIRRELEQDFQLKLPKVTLDKIMTGIALVTTNYFYKDVTKFIEICNIISGDDFQPDEFDPADAKEIMLGITEALLLWPPDEDAEDTEFSAEIREYIRQVLKEEGILKPFDVLRLAFEDDEAVTVDAEYSDDPEMYSAIYEMQQSKENELKAVLLENITALATQLRLLPIANGSAESLILDLQAMVEKADMPKM